MDIETIKMTESGTTVSLQRQYTISAVILGIIVIIAALIAYNEMTRASRTVSKEAQDIAELLEITSDIQYQITHANKAINIFMLEPERKEQRALLDKELDNSLSNIHTLSSHSIIKKLNLNNKLDMLFSDINQLKKSSDKVFNIRISANEQYPALFVSAESMRPARNKIYTVFNTTLDELRSSPKLTVTPELNLLLKARYTWLRTISEYRLYLTNRIGSFNEKRLLQQEQHIESHITLLKNQVRSLTAESIEKYFGFEGQALIKTLPGLINNWETAYLKVKKINHSGKWRLDTEMMRNTIIPLSEKIQHLINDINSTLKTENQTIMAGLNKAATTQSYVLAAVILLFMTYIILSIILLKQLLIKPLALIARALKNAATNPSTLNKLSLKKTKETTDLLDAFNLMSEQVNKRQSELEHRALHDSLTALPNRILLQQRLDYQTLIAERDDTQFTLMMLDLNRFKEINDTLGHHIGDELLIQVSSRLSNLIRQVDTIARLGGDEFAILLPNTNRHNAAVVAEKIASALKNEFIANTYTLKISSSIGITNFPDDGNDVNILLQRADIAMYCSKRNKSKYEFYDPDEDTHSVAQLSLGRDLELAILNNQLEMYFQAKIDINTGLINGAEALLRWNHPEHGTINPEKIIELAEHAGLINKLTYWIIHQSIKSCTEGELPDNFDLAINLSVQSLRDTNLLAETMDALSIHNKFKQKLTFEVTESAMMNNPEQSITILNSLTKIGIQISIDDFGTGFSSLAYLKQLPVNQLKIDKSFVMDMQTDDSDKAIVFSTINLSHSLGLNVVAEGVENAETLRILKEMNCDVAQGYYFSKPVPIKDFFQFIADYKPEESN